MKNIYTTNEWKGYGKQNYQCHRQKFFDGHENNWETEEKHVDSWKKDDPDMPDWLRSRL